MRQRLFGGLLAVLAMACVAAPVQGEDYALDASHAGVTFKVSHLGLSWTYGRFKEVNGQFSTGAAPSFQLDIKTETIDTDNKQRDDHLRSPDFFNAKQFPLITFRSTAVKVDADGYTVTGDFTMHGVTKPITMKLVGGKTAEFPKGVARTGFTTELILKRSEYGIEKFKEGVGDDVYVSISFEGTAKK